VGGGGYLIREKTSIKDCASMAREREESKNWENKVPMEAAASVKELPSIF